jgi:hypothetical protein
MPMLADLFAVFSATVIVVTTTTLPAVIEVTATEVAASVISTITEMFSGSVSVPSIPVAMAIPITVPVIAVSVVTPPAVALFTEAVLFCHI